MASPGDDNVVALPLPPRRNGPSAELLEMLRGAVDALDDLSDGFGRIRPSLQWPIARWHATSIPFRMRLVSVDQQLKELRKIDPAEGPDTVWAIELSSARTRFEQQLQMMVNLLDIFLSGGMSADERAWQIQKWTAVGKEFLVALGRLRSVIVARHPEIFQPQRPYIRSC
jgi:hypothetical protein